MQLDYGSVECTVDGVAINGVGGSTRIPIPRTYAPSDCNQSQRTGDRSNAVIARTRIWRKPGSRTVSQCPAESAGCRLEVPRDVVVGATRQFGRDVAMASHGMTPCRDLLHEPGVLLGKPPHDEHRGGHTMSPQRVQNAD